MSAEVNKPEITACTSPDFSSSFAFASLSQRKTLGGVKELYSFSRRAAANCKLHT
jgi:hypothetical protein